MKRRELLKDQAFRKLKDMILSGEYPPGTVLSEQQLSETLGMSKAPIRSSIERLDFDGYVRVAPQQGIVVAELSLEAVIDHFELRTALETYVVGRLVGKLTDSQRNEIEANLALQREVAAQSDLKTYRGIDIEFHLLLARAHGNAEIERVMTRQTEKLQRIITRIIGQHPPRMLEGTLEHAAILQAMLGGSEEEAVRLMQEHLAWGRRFLATRLLQ